VNLNFSNFSLFTKTKKKATKKAIINVTASQLKFIQVKIQGQEKN